MSSEKGQKHIYAQEHQLYYYYNNFRGHLKRNLRQYTTLEKLQALIQCLFKSENQTLIAYKTWQKMTAK